MDNQAPTKVALFTRDRHGGVRIAVPRRFPDSAGVGSIPLAVQEVGEAVAHFPIAFIGEEKPQLSVIVTVTNNHNLFVNPDGTWLDGAYIPALLRRRPFAIAPTDKADTFAIVVDEGDKTLDPAGGVLLFDEDKPSALCDELLKLTRELQPALVATEAFVNALNQHDLLVARTVTLAGAGEPSVLQGLRLIDPEKLAALPEATVIEWHRNGYLGAIALINSSQGRWPALMRLAAQRAGARA